MTQPGKSQQPRPGGGGSNPARPEAPPERKPARDKLERDGIPPEMVRAEQGPEDTETKGTPNSDRAEMEATAAKHKAASSPRK